MGLLLAPYNNAMRIGQGFNSYTQQICIDDAVVIDHNREDNTLTNDGFTMVNLRDEMMSGSRDFGTIEHHDAPNAKNLEGSDHKQLRDAETEHSDDADRKHSDATDEPQSPSPHRAMHEHQGPSQVVSYSSRFVNKLTEVTDDMNISASMSIKYGAIGGAGRGSFIDSDKFKESDLNFYISVKVVNQTINIKDALIYNPLDSTGGSTSSSGGAGKDSNATTTGSDSKSAEFTKVYGDSFISGFLEGGDFNAIVSMKILNKQHEKDIAAQATVALSVGMGEVSAGGDVNFAKKNIENNCEVTIQVSWSGGGHIKPPGKQWDIDTLKKVAAGFPDLVAKCPQRTYAILTKYDSLRSYVNSTKKGTPLVYETASIYTNAMLDAYMDYKSMYGQLSADMFDVKAGIKKYVERKDTKTANVETVSPHNDELKFDPSNKGAELAKHECRWQMVKLVQQVEAVTNDPQVALKEDVQLPCQNPSAFAARLPKFEFVDKSPVDLIGEEEIVAAGAKAHDLYDGGSLKSLHVDEQEKVKSLLTERPTLGQHFRLGTCVGADAGELFCCLDFMKPDFMLTMVRVLFSGPFMSALHLEYSNGLVAHFGAAEKAQDDKVVSLEIDPEQQQRVIACSIEVGSLVSDKSSTHVTALCLYTNRGTGLLGYADDKLAPAIDGKATRKDTQFEDLKTTHFDASLNKGHLKGFWGRCMYSTQWHPDAGLYKLGPIWGNQESSGKVGRKTHLKGELAIMAMSSGTWNTTTVYPADTTRNHFTVKIPYKSQFPTTIAVGISCLDVKGLPNYRFTAAAKDLTTSDFNMNLDTNDTTLLYQGRCAWMAVPTNDPSKIQTGIIETSTPRELVISFARRFPKDPKVLVWINGLEQPYGAGKSLRFSLYTSDEGTTSFKMHLDCAGMDLNWLSATWVAFTDDSGLEYGTYIDKLKDANKDLITGNVSFKPGKFSSPPMVVTAFSFLNIDCTEGASYRAVSEITEVTPGGFKYSTSTWGGSPRFESQCNWLAFRSPT